MKRAYIYARVSTEEQARHGYSIGAQLDFLRKYAAEHGYTVIHEFVDEGVSGRKGYKKRPAMNQLIANLDNVDVILFLKLDRWFRSVKLYYEVDDILNAYGVSWIAAQEDYETVTAAGRFKVNIMLSVAQNEAERTSERIRFVFDNMREQGKIPSAMAPLGFDFVDHKFIENPEELVALRATFDYYIDSHSIMETRNFLLNKFGIKYSYEGMKHLLSNETYIGARGTDPVIDSATFYKAKELLAARSQRKPHAPASHVYLFSGLIYCKDCGSRMSGHTQSNGKRIYYRCHARLYDKNCIHTESVREDRLEQWLLDNLTQELAKLSVQISDAAAQPKGDPDKIRLKMQKLKDLYLEDLISKDVYKADYTKLERELEQCIAVVPTSCMTIEEIEEALKLYPALTPANKKAFWHRVLSRIEVDHDGNIFLS